MSEIRIVTDSTAFLPQEILDKYKIEVVPLYVNFPDEVIIDGSINNKVFFEKLKKASKLPFTSQPAPGDFVQVYKKIIDNGDEIISIHISSSLSGTVESATAAKKMLASDRISVVDSYFTSAGLAMQVIAAAKAVQEGKTRDEITAMLEKLRNKIRILFVPATLEYLRKGGRIGGAQALLGTILQIKPILMIKDGKVDVFEKVRTMKKALGRIVEELPGKGKVNVTILQAESGETPLILQKLIKERLPESVIEIFELSPVISTHAGPGVVGIAFLEE